METGEHRTTNIQLTTPNRERRLWITGHRCGWFRRRTPAALRGNAGTEAGAPAETVGDGKRRITTPGDTSNYFMERGRSREIEFRGGAPWPRCSVLTARAKTTWR